MTIKVSCHLNGRHGHMDGTNRRAYLIGVALDKAGCDVQILPATVVPPADCDLVLQTGFAPTPALTDAIDRRIPYILGECPVFRHDPAINYNNWVSWGYNGLCGGAWFPPAPDDELDKPRLRPMKTEGSTIIFAQKPNDRSLRGADHNAWLDRKLLEFPDAEFRPHPLMVTQKPEPVTDALQRCLHAITYSSTAGAEAHLFGCISEPEHPGSWGYGVTDREAWLHERSWHGFPDDMFRDDPRVGAYILSGYDEARHRASQDLVEYPRLKSHTNMHSYLCSDPRTKL